MRPITVVVGPLAAASANAIAQSQTVGAGTPVALNGATVSGGVATLDMPRRVAITSAGNDSGIAFTIAGRDRYGNPQRETLAGVNAGTVASALDYASVSSITPSGASTGNVTAGTNGVASSSWVRTDEWAPGAMVVSIELTGTLGYWLEQSFDDPNSPTDPLPLSAMTWSLVSTGNANAIIPIANAPTFLRLTATSGAGSARGVFVQYSSSNVNIDIVKA